MMQPKRLGPVALRTLTSPEKAKLPSHAKRKPTFGQCDHQAPWRDDDQWGGLSMRPGYQNDEDWFRANPHRRLRIRRSLPYELNLTSSATEWRMIVVRSRHDVSWNTIAFRFYRGNQLWNEPQSDEEALQVAGRFDPRVMLDAALLLISYRYVSHVFSGFDYGARGE